MFKKAAAILLTAVMITMMCFSFAACEEKAPDVSEVIDGIMAAQDDVESYNMEMTTGIKMVMDLPEEELSSMGMASNMEVNMGVTGEVDNKNQKMKMVMSIDMSAPDEDPTKMDVEFYYVDGMLYAMMDIPLMNPQWMKSEMPYGEFMEQMDFVTSDLEILTKAASTITGSEKVGGVNCYVLELTPSMEELWDIAMQQSQMAGGAMPDMPMEDIEEIIDSFSVKYWVSKDNYYIMKSEMVIGMKISPEDMGMYDAEGSVAMDMTLNILMSDYNKPVSIVLPPEAENAVEESFW